MFNTLDYLDETTSLTSAKRIAAAAYDLLGKLRDRVHNPQKGSISQAFSYAYGLVVMRDRMRILAGWDGDKPPSGKDFINVLKSEHDLVTFLNDVCDNIVVRPCFKGETSLATYLDTAVPVLASLQTNLGQY